MSSKKNDPRYINLQRYAALASRKVQLEAETAELRNELKKLQEHAAWLEHDNKALRQQLVDERTYTAELYEVIEDYADDQPREAFLLPDAALVSPEEGELSVAPENVYDNPGGGDE